MYYTTSLYCLQFQQTPATKGRIGAEALAFASSSRKWEDGEVAIHTTLWRVGFGDQETKGWGIDI